MRPSESCSSTAAHKAACSRLRPRCGSIRVLPRVQIFLHLAAQNLAELGVDAADVRGQRLPPPQAEQRRGSGAASWLPPPRRLADSLTCWLASRSFNQPQRQPQLRAQIPLAPPHLARIGFMVVSGQVQQPVKHQHLATQSPASAPARRLPNRRLHADRHIACDRSLCLGPTCSEGNESTSVGLFFAAKARDSGRASRRRWSAALSPARAAAPRLAPGSKIAPMFAQRAAGKTSRSAPQQKTSPERISAVSRKLQFWVDEDHRAQRRGSTSARLRSVSR